MSDKNPHAHGKFNDICANQIPMEKVQTLGEFIIEKQGEISFAKGELSRLLSAIRLAAKVVNREVNRAGLGNVLGAMGNENIQGEQQMKLDVFANIQFIASLKARGECCGIASEENDSYLAFDNDNSKEGKYVVLFDPLDGSSNIDVNVSIGTIFSIYKRKSNPGEIVTLEDFLQPGTEQVAAGYVVYGSSTMLVYTTGHGVNGFTLDPSIGTFYLSHPNMRIPETGTIYSINEGNFPLFPDGIKKWIKYCHEEDKPTGRPYSTRYIGSLVSDFHRNLIKGGVYVYPQTSKSPNGKLRLLYECNPLAFIAEQAGGKASNGFKRIMEVESTELHQRVPLIIGSPKMVDKVCEFLQNPN